MRSLALTPPRIGPTDAGRPPSCRPPRQIWCPTTPLSIASILCHMGTINAPAGSLTVRCVANALRLFSEVFRCQERCCPCGVERQNRVVINPMLSQCLNEE